MRGRATLVTAVIAALDHIKALPHGRRVVVITGHADDCHPNDVSGELKTHFDETRENGRNAVSLDFLIDFDVSSTDAPKIKLHDSHHRR